MSHIYSTCRYIHRQDANSRPAFVLLVGRTLKAQFPNTSLFFFSSCEKLSPEVLLNSYVLEKKGGGRKFTSRSRESSHIFSKVQMWHITTCYRCQSRDTKVILAVCIFFFKPIFSPFISLVSGNCGLCLPFKDVRFIISRGRKNEFFVCFQSFRVTAA